MAHYFVKADKDTTLLTGTDSYGTGSYQNVGFDEVLEVGKAFQKDSSTVIETKYRTVIKFPITVISASMASGEISNDAKFYLNMKDAGSSELMQEQTLHVYPVSQSWVEGSGKMSDIPNTMDGASWQFRDEYSGSKWDPGTGKEFNWGATYFSGSGYAASQPFNKDDKTDMRMDVTNIVKQWYSGSFDNEGFLIKRTDADEQSVTKFGQFKFFSADTHTVYHPTLEVEWDDSSWSTGSLSPLSADDIDRLNISIENFRPEYKVGSLSKIRVHGRELYPARTFSTSSQYLDKKYMPSASAWYSVVDNKTDDVVVPFGTGSKLSCDSSGNYFRLRTSGLEPERFYSLKFKVVSGSGISETVNYYDDNRSFKVVR